MTDETLETISISWNNWWIHVTLTTTQNTTQSGPYFDRKMPSYQYRNTHYGDKIILHLSYFHNEIFCSDKTEHLYWNGAIHAYFMGYTISDHHDVVKCSLYIENRGIIRSIDCQSLVSSYVSHGHDQTGKKMPGLQMSPWCMTRDRRDWRET